MSPSEWGVCHPGPSAGRAFCRPGNPSQRDGSKRPRDGMSETNTQKRLDNIGWRMSMNRSALVSVGSRVGSCWTGAAAANRLTLPLPGCGVDRVLGLVLHAAVLAVKFGGNTGVKNLREYVSRRHGVPRDNHIQKPSRSGPGQGRCSRSCIWPERCFCK